MQCHNLRYQMPHDLCVEQPVVGMIPIGGAYLDLQP